MAAYRQVYDSCHLHADCQEPGSAPEPYAVWGILVNHYITLCVCVRVRVCVCVRVCACVRVCVCAQHIVFAVKFLVAAFIPDVPADVKLAIKRVRSIYLSIYLSLTHSVVQQSLLCSIGKHVEIFVRRLCMSG